VSTGVPAFLLCLLPLSLSGTPFTWIAIPFWLPGLLALAVFFQTGFHSRPAIAFLALAVMLNFLFDWAFLLAVWKFVERLTRAKSE
jgi:hypothetical protein